MKFLLPLIKISQDVEFGIQQVVLFQSTCHAKHGAVRARLFYPLVPPFKHLILSRGGRKAVRREMLGGSS